MAYRETDRIRERRAARRDELLHHAEQLVRRHGYRGLTMQVLAREAGVAVGSLYRHFDTKDELALEVFRRVTAREVDAVAAAMMGEGTAGTRLERAAEVFARRALKAPRLAWALIAEPAGDALDGARIEYRQAYADLFHGVLAAGLAAGELPEQDCALSAAALVGALAEAVLGPLATHDDPEHVIAQLRQFCRRAIGAGRE